MSREVPCNCLKYGRERRCGTLGRCNNGNRACYGSFGGNGDRQPNIICESLGGVRCPGLWLDLGSQRGEDCQRYGEWKGTWGFLFLGHIGGCLSGKQRFPD